MPPTNLASLAKVTEDQLGYLVHLHLTYGPASAVTFLSEGRELFTLRTWRLPPDIEAADEVLIEAVASLASSSEADAVVVGSAVDLYSHPEPDGCPGDGIVSVGTTLIARPAIAWAAIRLRSVLGHWSIDAPGSKELMLDPCGPNLAPDGTLEAVGTAYLNYSGPTWNQDEFFRALDMLDHSTAVDATIAGFVSALGGVNKRMRDPMRLMRRLPRVSLPVRAATAA